MSTSRSISPAYGAFPAVIHLENLESCQDRWARQCEASRRNPPAPPQLNSPRSLKACEVCGVKDPARLLEKLSLKQHLHRVMRTANLDALAASLKHDVESKAAMQVAVLAFQRAAICIGTSTEKLVAYHAYQSQEQARVPLIAAVREVRQRLIAENPTPQQQHHHSDVAMLSGGDRESAAAAAASPRHWHAVPALTESDDRSSALPYVPRDASRVSASFFGLSAPHTEMKTQQQHQHQHLPSPRSGRDVDEVNSSFELSRTASATNRRDASVISIDSAQLDWALSASTSKQQGGPIAAPAASDSAPPPRLSPAAASPSVISESPAVAINSSSSKRMQQHKQPGLSPTCIASVNGVAAPQREMKAAKRIDASPFKPTSLQMTRTAMNLSGLPAAPPLTSADDTCYYYCANPAPMQQVVRL